eukprot:SAG31_NODE_2183_length_6238_cov_4.637917_1_plen_169_part_00
MQPPQDSLLNLVSMGDGGPMTDFVILLRLTNFSNASLAPAPGGCAVGQGTRARPRLGIQAQIRPYYRQFQYNRDRRLASELRALRFYSSIPVRSRAPAPSGAVELGRVPISRLPESSRNSHIKRPDQQPGALHAAAGAAHAAGTVQLRRAFARKLGTRSCHRGTRAQQ